MKKLITLCLLLATIFEVDAQVKGVIIAEAKRESCFAYAYAESPVNPNVKILVVSSYIYRQKYKETNPSDKLSNASKNYYINILNNFDRKLEEISTNERIFVSGEAKDIVFDSNIAKSAFSGIRVAGDCPITADEQLKLRSYSSTRAFSVDCRNRLISAKRKEGYHVFQVEFGEFYETRDSYGQLWTEEHHKLVLDQVERLSPLIVDVYKPNLIKNLLNYKRAPVSDYKIPGLVVSRESSSGSKSNGSNSRSKSYSSSSSSTKSSSSGSTSNVTIYNNIFAAEAARKYREEKALQDFGNAVVDLFAPSPEKVAREKRELEARQKRSEIERYNRIKDSKKKYEELYVGQLMKKAKEGDVDARMNLILARNSLCVACDLPDSKKWYSMALATSNIDALLFEATIRIDKVLTENYLKELSERKVNYYINKDSSYKEAMPYINKAIDLGSTDAIIFLADWYNKRSYAEIISKGSKGEYQNKYSNGDNPELALKLFQQAADKGSPNAMYYLGMIYKYGRTVFKSKGSENKYWVNCLVKYEVKKNEKLAFEYFSKALQPDYQTTNFAKYQSYYRDGSGDLKTDGDNLSSHFEKEVYLELASMYEKGKVVSKDKMKAEEYRKLYASYANINQF